MNLSAFYFVTCLVAYCYCAPNVFQFEIGKKNEMTALEKALQLLLNSEKGSSGSGLQSFSWSDCGTAAYPAHIEHLSISPDPLSFPGPLNIAANFNINQQLNAPVKAVLQISKKIGSTYIKLPCIDQFGSCTYEDVCELLTAVTQCPDPLTTIGIDCHCPFRAKAYDLKTVSFQVAASLIPPGDYKAEAHVSYKNGTVPAACLKLDFSFQ